MFGLKTKILKSVEKKYFDQRFNTNNKVNFIDELLILLKIKSILNEENKNLNIQSPGGRFTNKKSRIILKKFNKFHLNNIGNWTENSPYHLPGKLEKQLINKFIALYKGNQQELNGYITNGGTESNLYAGWLGREYLKNKLDTKKIIGLKTSLSHYSIEKSFNIIGVPYKDIAISKKTWGMDIKSLKQEVIKQIEKGYRGFLIPLTIAYTNTGSSDPIDEICKEITTLKRKYKSCEFFVWIDAAFAGFPKAIIDKQFQPFKNKNIQLLVSDLHKFPGIPYSTGLVVYRKKLTKNIRKKVTYIKQDDTTISGSRSGLNVIAAWYSMTTIGIKEWNKIIKETLLEKELYIQKIKNISTNIEIINEKNTPQICLLAKNKEEAKRLHGLSLEKINEKILFTDGLKNISLYRVFFLPRF